MGHVMQPLHGAALVGLGTVVVLVFATGMFLLCDRLKARRAAKRSDVERWQQALDARGEAAAPNVHGEPNYWGDVANADDITRWRQIIDERVETKLRGERRREARTTGKTKLAYAAIALALLGGTAGAVAAFRSAIPFGTASSWSSAVNSDPNAVRGPWFNTNEHSLFHTNSGGSGTDWALDGQTFNVAAFGCVGDNVHDDTACTQAAADAAKAAGGGVVFFPGTPSHNNYLITGTITTDNTVSFMATERSGVTISLTGTAFTNNVGIGKPVAIAMSVDLATNNTTAVGHPRAGFIRNLFFSRIGDFQGSNPAYDLVALNIGANIVIENNQFRNLWSSVYGAGGYVDEIHVRDAYFYYPHDAGWQIHLGYLGDGHILEGLSFDQSPAGGGSIYLNNTRGTLISTPIAATIYILNSESVTVSNAHGENQAQVTLDTCKGCRIVDSIFFKRSTTAPPVVVTWNGDSSQRGLPNVIDDVQFISYGDINSFQYDVQLSSQANLQVRNCFRHFQGSTSDVERSTATGIMMEDENTNPLTVFNQRSNVFSQWSQIEQGQIRFMSDYEAPPAAAFRIAGLSGTSLAAPFQAASATYFYTFDLVFNKVKGPIASADLGESSVALTNGGNGAILTVNTGLPVGIFYRLWRGTSSGVYTAYVDIPVFGGIHFYDNGTQVNGYPWVSSGLPTRQTFLPAQRESQDHFEGYLTAAPVVGTWAVQDTFWNTAPSSGAPIGWVCTVAGTPGTWVPINALVNNASSTQITLPAGSGTQTGNVPVGVYRNATPVSSVTSGETDAQVYTMPANTLSTDGQALWCLFGFHHANNTNSTTAKFYFNGTAIQTLTSAGALQQTYGQFTLTRTDSSTMRALSMVAQDTSNVSKATGAVGVTWSGSIIIKTTVTGATTNGDLTADYLRCDWLP